MHFALLAVALLASAVTGQRIGNWVPEVHPPLTTWNCTVAGGCVAQNTSVVLDAKFRWLHVDGSSVKCTTNQMIVNGTYCFDQENCHHNCIYEGANYSAAGVHTANAGQVGSSITMDLYSPKNITLTPRVYLFDEDKQEYLNAVFTPNTELTFEVDVSNVSCNGKGTLYLVEMQMDGGLNAFNEGGAAMGVGYCDAQCRVRDFINGVVNTNNSGVCCAEHDFWESNRVFTSSSVHPCVNHTGIFGCTGKECLHILDGGLCSQRQCGIAGRANTYFGKNMKVDTSKPMTVVSQFLAGDKTNKTLGSIKRIYYQNGKKITTDENGDALVYNDETCKGTGVIPAGGMASVLKFLERGTVITLSHNSISTDGTASTCYLETVSEKQLEEDTLKATVTFTNIRWGELGSTVNSDGSFM